MKLRDYQVETIERMADPEPVFLALDTGLGKTRCCIEYAKRIRAQRVLVFCPKIALPVWPAEAQKWGLQHCALTVLTYDAVSRGSPMARDALRAGRKTPYDLLVLDEAHMLKNDEALRTERIYAHFKPICRKIIPVSATPFLHHAGEIYPHLAALAPHLIQNLQGVPYQKWEFEQRYCKLEKFKVGDQLRERITGSKNRDELRRRIAPFIYRKKKEDVLSELPPLDFVTLPLQLSLEHTEKLSAYEEILVPGMDENEILAAIESEQYAAARAALGVAKAIAAVDYLREFAMANRLKTLVFAHHHAALDVLEQGLSGFGVARIDGNVSGARREREIARFLDDELCLFFLGQTTACSTAITLVNEKTQPRDVFFVEAFPPFATLYQAASRVHRIGQTGGVLARFMCAASTIDERAQETIARRVAEINELY